MGLDKVCNRKPSRWMHGEGCHGPPNLRLEGVVGYRAVSEGDTTGRMTEAGGEVSGCAAVTPQPPVQGAAMRRTPLGKPDAVPPPVRMGEGRGWGAETDNRRLLNSDRAASPIRLASLRDGLADAFPTMACAAGGLRPGSMSMTPGGGPG